MCSAIASGIFVGLKVVGDRLIVASKLEEVGVWGVYAGIALDRVSGVMLNPVRSICPAEGGGGPIWLDSSLTAMVIAAWGVAGVVLLHRRSSRSVE